MDFNFFADRLFSHRHIIGGKFHNSTGVMRSIGQNIQLPLKIASVVHREQVTQLPRYDWPAHMGAEHEIVLN